MKIILVLWMILLSHGKFQDSCTNTQALQLHQFKDLFLYLYQNTGYIVFNVDSCKKESGNDIYLDSALKGSGTTDMSVGHQINENNSSIDIGVNSLAISIKDSKLIDNPYGLGWNGYFSDIDSDNLLRSLLTAEGKKRNILFLNYIRGINQERIVHLISFVFEGDQKKRYFVIDTKRDRMTFIISENFNFIREFGVLNFSKADFSHVTMKSKRSGSGFGFEKCLVSIKMYPDQDITNLTSCAALLFDLNNGLWKIQVNSLTNDNDYLKMFNYFIDEYDNERKNFNLDMFNILLFTKFRWMEPVLFESNQIAKRLHWIICATLNPEYYSETRELSSYEKELMGKMYSKINEKCQARKRRLKK